MFKLDIRLRILISFLLAFLAFTMQNSGMSAIFWFPVLLLSAFFLWVKGVSVEGYTYYETKEWKNVTLREFLRAASKAKKAKKLSTTSFISKLVFVIMILIFLGAFLTAGIFPKTPLFYLIFDSLVIFSIVFLSGTRNIWIPQDIDIKLDSILYSYNSMKEEPGYEIIPQFLVGKRKNGKMIPIDAKLFVRLSNSPDWFIGLQFQVSVNSVQNKKYPYLYGVIVIKKNYLDKITSKLSANSSPAKFAKERCGIEHRGIIIREERNPEVDVIIIRQETSKGRGYYTRKKDINKIVKISLKLLECMVNNEN